MAGGVCPQGPPGQGGEPPLCSLCRDIGKRLEVRRTVTACLGEPGHITRLEHAQARLTLSYNRRGDLAIHLVSPMGTRSTLLAARCLPLPPAQCPHSQPCPPEGHGWHFGRNGSVLRDCPQFHDPRPHLHASPCTVPGHVPEASGYGHLASWGSEPGGISHPAGAGAARGAGCGPCGVGLVLRLGPQTAVCPPPRRPHDYSADGFNDWAFMTTHSWDEDPSGEWVLEIENTSEANNYGKWGRTGWSGGTGRRVGGQAAGSAAGSQCLLTLASSPSRIRDTDQVHARAVRHSPRGAAHASREQRLQDPHVQPGLRGSVVGAVGVWGLRLGGRGCPP